MYENIIKNWRISTILPLSNAEIEKTFSNFSYLKNNLRNKLLNQHLDW